jgi:hypothetical protein
MNNYPIESCTWGAFVIDGQEHSETGDSIRGVGKDIRVVGKEVSEWKERKGHKLKFDMVTGVFNPDVEVLIIGIGHFSAIRCPDKVLEKIRAAGIREIIPLPTPDACQEYNRRFAANERVALLAHGTC